MKSAICSSAQKMAGGNEQIASEVGRTPTASFTSALPYESWRYKSCHDGRCHRSELQGKS